MKSLILVGGFGTRLPYPSSATKAKGLVEYKGKPIISYIIDKIPQDTSLLKPIRNSKMIFITGETLINRKVILCYDD